MTELRFYIGGIGGVGKSTVGQALARIIPGACHFSGSEIMMEICKVSSRQDLENMDLARKQKIEKTEYPEFINKHPTVIVDGHCRLLPEQARVFNCFVYLTAPPETIQERRLSGNGRRKKNHKLPDICDEQSVYEIRMSATEEACKVTFLRISNTGTVKETCNLILLAVESFVRR